MNVHLLMARLVAFACVVCCIGCPKPGIVSEIELDPVVIGRDHNGKVTALSAEELFKSASEAYKVGKYDEAIRLFRDVAEVFADKDYAPHAHFNAALSLERLKRWSDALRELGKARAGFEKHKLARDALDVQYQRVRCLEQLEKWRPLVRAATTLLAAKTLGVTERIETEVRLGIAKYQLGRLAESERALKLALEDHRQNLGVPSLKGNPYVSRAQYLVGAIYGELFATIRFRLPVERMRRDLSDKSSFFLKAQSAYLNCVRLTNSYWSVAAGFQLGKLYEDFFDAMMAAEVPSELTPDQKEIYLVELKRKIKPLVHRAIDVYERNLGMSDRQRDGDEWAKKTAMQLERMRGILRSEFKDVPD